MATFEFTIIASGLDPEDPDFANRFFEAGCDDASIAFQKGAIILEFEREAANIGQAFASAVENVEAAGATVERLEPDYLVSLSDIAARAGVTRAAVSLYSRGERDEGFPSPIARVTSDMPLWDWSTVAEWFFVRQKIDRGALLTARIVKEANLEIEARGPGHNLLVKTIRATAEMELA